MTPESRRLSSTLPVSVFVTKWLPNLSSIFQLNGRLRDTAPLRPHSVSDGPDSLREAHNSACAWFLGPKAENADSFRMSVDTILNDVMEFRKNFALEDEVCIPYPPSQRCFSTSARFP